MTFLSKLTGSIKFNWQGQWRSFWRGFSVVLIFGLVAVGIPGVNPSRNDHNFQALGVARDHLFDFAAWEADAALDKAATALLSPASYMTERDQIEYVRDYLQTIQNIQTLETAVSQIYIDPDIADPDARSAALRAARDQLRAEQAEQQALAESIVEGHLSTILSEYGFGVAGQILPPVGIRFTRLPTIMIVSPRDHIERTGSYALEHGLTVDQMEHLEAGVDSQLGVSSLIVPLGGLAVYPAMLVETSYLPHVYRVGAHEWMHHYLAFYPLGMNYGVTPELYTMNETVAGIVEEEIGWAVLNRYYPELAGAPPDFTPHTEQRPQPDVSTPVDPNVFDFRAEMRETRIRVDQLLAEGQIEEAERYMEARRAVFVENGYAIRKLNQAYFAFYGSYADEPGATGSDPVGPALRELRYYSDSLLDFVHRVRMLTSFEALQAELEKARAD